MYSPSFAMSKALQAKSEIKKVEKRAILKENCLISLERKMEIIISIVRVNWFLVYCGFS